MRSENGHAARSSNRYAGIGLRAFYSNSKLNASGTGSDGDGRADEADHAEPDAEPPATQPTFGPGSSVAATINTWEDDPFSEATPTVNPSNATPLAVSVPANNAPLLQTRILDLEPRPASSLLALHSFATGQPKKP